MKHFLILVMGLIMMSSFAQASVCSSQWWKSATGPQVEFEAEFRGRLAMNDPCKDGVMPLTLALENNDDPSVFSVILEHFELDRHQAEHTAAIQLRQDYEELLSDVESIARHRSEESSILVVHAPLHSFDLDGYERDPEIRHQFEHIAMRQLRQDYRALLSSMRSFVFDEIPVESPPFSDITAHSTVHSLNVRAGETISDGFVAKLLEYPHPLAISSLDDKYNDFLNSDPDPFFKLVRETYRPQEEREKIRIELLNNNETDKQYLSVFSLEDLALRRELERYRARLEVYETIAKLTSESTPKSN